MLESAERIAAEAVEMCTAKPLGMGLKDLMLTPSHAMLTIHEIVAHATELDRIVGYEANYAGTSFVKLSDVGKLKYGSKLMNITADDDGRRPGDHRLRRRRREDEEVPDHSRRHSGRPADQPRDGAATSATRPAGLHVRRSSWRDYPFLRMPNVHLEAGPEGLADVAQIIADTKDGVLIDGRGSYSIDQQRYNGQFGGNCFWEIKNGKITRQVTDVTYNAITTDFWANLDADRQPGDVEDVRHGRRRQGSADADQQHLARLARTSGSRRSWWGPHTPRP